jgi:TatD DNase family protein
MIDTHVHLDLLVDPLALARAAAAGVTRIVGIGTDPRKSPLSSVPVPEGLHIDYAWGLHPYELRTRADVDDALSVLRERLLSGGIAVGETGLDHRPDLADATLQEYAYESQLRLRRELNLPVILHGVRRDERMLALHAKHARPSDAPTIWHGFSSSRETAVAATKRGIAISIGFMALNERARRVREAIPAIPDSLLLVETDAPPLEPHRLTDVIEAVARLRGTSAAAIDALTTANAQRLLPSRASSHAIGVAQGGGG